MKRLAEARSDELSAAGATDLQASADLRRGDART
jgi:hypothetical protein